VESEPERGTTFTLLLPIDCREKAETSGAAVESSKG